MWTKNDIVIELDEYMTDDPVMTATISTPDGEVMVMAEMLTDGSALVLRRLHIHGENVGKNEFGHTRLRNLVGAVLDALEAYDEIVVEGAVRTSGAGKGRRPCAIRFTRASFFRENLRKSEYSLGGKGSGH